MPKLLHIIVACAENRVIGRDRRVPWRIPEDTRFFHDQTAGKICVLGRIGFDTWPRATKDGRQPIVLTSRPLAGARSHGLEAGRAREPLDRESANPPIAVRSLDDALAVAETLPGDVYICGGQRIYEEALALNRPMRLYLTLVHIEVPGDTFFPEWRHLDWREVSRREGADQDYRYTFLTLERYAARNA